MNYNIMSSKMFKKITRLLKNYKLMVIKIFLKENFFKMNKIIFLFKNKKMFYKIIKKTTKIVRKFIVNLAVLMMIVVIKISY